ncbi:hypothetical protein [Salinicola rhizosphaerae]|uniref:Uncharacterized protein n=1 Tax=Salinicola rhizosphaerae TaxID=1443141 RepID=A0ABQ3E872_9GAMM|nr:hypothetical protein [Salinicola rhizosphaerae]GHB24133.1 hypothetical protein GCM10009038_23990 [Salinicola rhizosphaerae]
MTDRGMFKVKLPQAGEASQSGAELDHSLYVVAYNGQPDIYLRAIDADGEVSQMLLDEHQARALRDVLSSALDFLDYDTR